MLHVTGVIILLLFSTSSQNGAWEKRLHCLDWACDCWVKRVFVLIYLLPFEVRGDGKHVGRYRLNRLPFGERIGLPQGAHRPKRVAPKLKFLSLSHKSFVAFY